MNTVAYISGGEDDIPAKYVAEIRALGVGLRCRRCVGEEETFDFANGAELVWMRGPNLGLTGAVLRRLDGCRAIFRSGSGLDALPCDTAKELGIAVLNTPESISRSVAEHAVALLLASVRRIAHYDRSVRAGAWEEPNGMEWGLDGRVLGLVGYGRIARHVERMVSGFGVRSIHHDPFAPGSIPLYDLLSQSDFVSLHCPLTNETRGLVGARELSLMKRGAILVNTSRGPVVDEAALANALSSGHIGAAALDVLGDEPPAAGNPLIGLDNVIVTPHIAAFSGDFEKNFWECSVRRIAEFFGV